MKCHICVAAGVKSKTTGSSIQLWPPPEPPQHMDHSSLPANLRPARHQEPAAGEDRDPRETQPQSRDHERHSGQPDRGNPGPGQPPVSRSRAHLGQEAASGNVGDQEHQSHSAENADPGQEDALQVHGGRSQEVADTESGTQGQEAAQISPQETPAVSATPQPVAEAAGGDECMDVSPPYLQRQNSQQCPIAGQDIVLGTPTCDGTQQTTKQLAAGSGLADEEDQGPVFFYTDPVWTQDGIEDFYEEIDTTSLDDLPTVLSSEETPLQQKVGLWGELLVKNYLEQQQSVDGSVHGVRWMNENGERGKPYDFVVTVQKPGTADLDQIFIEVKSTLSSRKAFFEISSPQLKFAEEMKERFHVYRVFNAGQQQEVRLSRLQNLALRMHLKQIKLCIVV